MSGFRRSLPRLPTGVAQIAQGEEWVQSRSPHRLLDLGDLVCSGVGILPGTWRAGRSQ